METESVGATKRSGLLCSLDYEPFLSVNEDEIAVVVEPTAKLLATAEELGFRWTLFVDTLCLFAYRKHGLDGFVDAVEDQLREAVARGHDVQTHLHPNWLTATRSGGHWLYRYGDFLFGTMGGDESSIYELALAQLKRSSDYLEHLLGSVDSNYRTTAFRAGGYGIQPGDRAILKALQDAGYLFDSSIVPGMHRKTSYSLIDFRRVPEKGNYWLSHETGIETAAPSGVFEVPIAAGTVGRMDMARSILRYARNRLGEQNRTLYGSGTSRLPGASSSAEYGTVFQSLARKARIVAQRHDSLRIPGDPSVLLALTQSWLRKYAQDQPVFFSLLLHPKDLTARMLDDLLSYHRLITDRCDGQLDFLTFRELAERIYPKQV